MPDVRDPLGTLKAAVDELIAADPARFSDRESIKDLYRQLSRMEAAVAASDANRPLLLSTDDLRRGRQTVRPALCFLASTSQCRTFAAFLR